MGFDVHMPSYANTDKFVGRINYFSNNFAALKPLSKSLNLEEHLANEQ